jgi:hypothetical protein
MRPVSEARVDWPKSGASSSKPDSSAQSALTHGTRVSFTACVTKIFRLWIREKTLAQAASELKGEQVHGRFK